MQSFRKNAVFNTGFWFAAGIFAALAAFDLYHDGSEIPVIFIVATIACSVAAFWGRGNLVVMDSESVQLNMGLFNRKKVPLSDIKKIQIEPDRYVKIFIRNAAVKSVKISMALLHPDDRRRFEETVARLALEKSDDGGV